MNYLQSRLLKAACVGVSALLCAPLVSLANVPASEFFSEPDFTSVSLGPEGQRIAAMRRSQGEEYLEVSGVSGKGRVLKLSIDALTRKKASINQWAWIDTQRIAVQSTSERRGVEDLLDTRRKSDWFVWDLSASQSDRASLKKITTNGWVVDALPDQEQEFLYAKSGAYSKVYRIRADKLSAPGKLSKLSAVDGGQFTVSNEVRSVVGYAVRWFLDVDSQVQAVLHFNGEGVLTLTAFDGEGTPDILEQWQGKEEESAEKKIVPIALGPQEQQFYGLDLNEEDERSIYLLDYKSEEKTLVHEISAFKIVDLILSPDDGSLIGVRTVSNGNRVDEYFDKSISGEAAALDSVVAVAAEIERELGKSRDGKTRLVYRESYNQPGTFTVLHSASNDVIGERYPQLKNRLNGRQVSAKVTVGDLDIPYLLNLPESRRTPAPLVVLPHGGPFGVFDDPGYNPLTQYLVSAGYAVLRVSFRGSGGYSAALKDAGKKQWGGLMLDDIYGVTQAIVNRADIDAQRVCAMGISYGGYASAMMAIRHPEMFRCAATIAGVTDVNLMLRSTRMNRRQRDWTREYIGDPEADYEALKAASPAFLVSDLNVPIFVAHGGEDEVVDPEHAFRLKVALEASGKPFEWYFDPEIGHELGEGEQQVKVFEKGKAFLDSVLM